MPHCTPMMSRSQSRKRDSGFSHTCERADVGDMHAPAGGVHGCCSAAAAASPSAAAAASRAAAAAASLAAAGDCCAAAAVEGSRGTLAVRLQNRHTT